jgi:hypothetical protein
MAIKYINTFQSKALQKFTHIGDFWFENKPSGNPDSNERETVEVTFGSVRTKTQAIF